MKYHAPQLIFLALLCMSLGANIVKHGEPSKPYNGWAALRVMIIQLLLLWWGGFFAGFFG